MNKVYSRRNWQNEPSIATPLNDVNLNAMDYALNVVDTRVVNIDTTKANQSDLLQTVKSVTYNTTTGVFTFTFWNGTEVTVDLNIEKIPVSFSMSPQGVITMTTADGTEYTADVSELIKTYSFVDSSEIDFTVTTDASGNKDVTASIKAGSITGEKLQPNYLADCVSAKQGAESAEDNAAQSARDSDLSSQDAEAWAVGERNGQPVPSSDPTYENNAKWWAEHGTGNSFSGLTDTNFTNLQNGQIAKYNSTTQKWENANDEGGLLPHLYIDSEAGSTVTVVAPDSSVITPTQISSGHWECDVPSYGVYTIHAVLNGDDAVLSLTVDDVKEYHITDSHYSYTLNVYAPTGSTIRVTATGETYTGTGAGSNPVQFALHQASTTYSIQVTLDGVSKTDSVTTPSTSGGTGSKTFEFGTINVTLDTEFVGETITCVNGGTTISKTASSTSLVFYPPTTGTWTISGTVSGTTYSVDAVVSSLSTPVSVVLQTIPEGSTALPTDDIQTWLACAGITDKSYTTLNEVLADSTTLLALMSNNNAVDYLVRSKSWAGSSDGLVPKMTSATTPSGTVISDSDYSGQDNWKAFDGDSSTNWNSGKYNSSGDFYCGYTFTEEKIITKITGILGKPSAATSVSGKLQYYSENAWVDIPNGSITVTETPQNYSLTLETPIKTDRVRLFGTAAQAQRVVGIFELQFFHEGITTDSTAMTDIGANNYCADTLLADSTWAEAICNSTYFESVLNVKVPTMTSDTTPSGKVTYSQTTTYTSNPAWKAFDNDDSTYCAFEQTSYVSNYLGYVFTSSKKIKKAIVKLESTQVSRVSRLKITCASQEGGTWVDATDWATPNADNTFVINDNLDYPYWAMYWDRANTNPFGIITIQFYGREDV